MPVKFKRPFPDKPFALPHGIIRWDKPIEKIETGGKFPASVIVECECGNSRYVSVNNINQCFRKYDKYYGYCNNCWRGKKFAEQNRDKICRNAYAYKGDRHTSNQGYVFASLYPGDEFYECAWGRKRGFLRYLAEHRLVMMKHLGRPLEKWEHVHHKNGIRDDNRIENLELTDPKTHTTITGLQNENKRLKKEIDRLQKSLDVLLRQTGESTSPKRRGRRAKREDAGASIAPLLLPLLEEDDQKYPPHASAC